MSSLQAFPTASPCYLLLQVNLTKNYNKNMGIVYLWCQPFDCLRNITLGQVGEKQRNNITNRFSSNKRPREPVQSEKGLRTAN